jgi:putative endonuclease
MKRSETGVLGERLAGDFLGRNGYEVIERNYRCREGEIDIIAKQGETLVFVEVRTKRGAAYGGPEESITAAKMQRLRKAAARYAQERPGLPEARRIDVVAVRMGRGGRASRIEIIENAVEGVSFTG